MTTATVLPGPAPVPAPDTRYPAGSGARRVWTSRAGGWRCILPHRSSISRAVEMMLPATVHRLPGSTGRRP